MTTKARMSERVLPVQAGQDRALTLEIARWPSLRDRFPLPAGEGQGEGGGGLQLSGTWRFAWRGALFSFAQSSGLHGRFAGALVCGAFLPPHPSPLPEERENRALRFRQSGAPRLVAARDAVFPEREVEGCLANTGSFSGNVFKVFPSPRPSPRSFLAGRGRRRRVSCSPCLCRLSCGLLCKARNGQTRWHVFSAVGTSRRDVHAACSGATPSNASVVRLFVPPATTRAGTARRAIPTIALNTYARCGFVVGVLGNRVLGSFAARSWGFASSNQ